MIDDDHEEGPIELPRRERVKLQLIGAALALVMLGLIRWWPLFAIRQMEALMEIVRGG